MIEDIEQLRAENARLRETTEKLITALDKIEQQADYGQVDACQRIARAALSADPAPVGDAWQPIETAPRDGARFLAFERWNADYQIYECWWGEDFGNWEGWRDAWDSEPEPSHWMPLPPPPAGENGND